MSEVQKNKNTKILVASVLVAILLALSVVGIAIAFNINRTNDKPSLSEFGLTLNLDGGLVDGSQDFVVRQNDTLNYVSVDRALTVQREGEVVYDITNPSKTDYAFLGWSKSNNRDALSHDSDWDIVITQDITVYAIYQLASEVGRVTVTFFDSSFVSIMEFEQGQTIREQENINDHILEVFENPDKFWYQGGDKSAVWNWSAPVETNIVLNAFYYEVNDVTVGEQDVTSARFVYDNKVDQIDDITIGTTLGQIIVDNQNLADYEWHLVIDNQLDGVLNHDYAINQATVFVGYKMLQGQLWMGETIFENDSAVNAINGNFRVQSRISFEQFADGQQTNISLNDIVGVYFDYYNANGDKIWALEATAQHLNNVKLAVQQNIDDGNGSNILQGLNTTAYKKGSIAPIGGKDGWLVTQDGISRDNLPTKLIGRLVLTANRELTGENINMPAQAPTEGQLTVGTISWNEQDNLYFDGVDTRSITRSDIYSVTYKFVVGGTVVAQVQATSEYNLQNVIDQNEQYGLIYLGGQLGASNDFADGGWVQVGQNQLKPNTDLTTLTLIATVVMNNGVVYTGSRAGA